MSEWQVYVDDAAWMPFDYEPRTDTLVFAHLPRSTQRDAVFLDRRFIDRAEKSPPIRIRSLPVADVRDRAGPVHFIFHTGYCCSTLLTRALDLPGVSMGLREPGVLLSFGQHWTNARQTPGALDAMRITLDLLSRPLAAGETQIIKPSNVVNHLLPELMHLRPDANVLIMHSDLRSFLESIALRGASGRSLGRQIFRGFAAAIPLDASFDPEEQLLLTDMQVAAQAWLMQASFLTATMRYHGRNRVRTLSSDAFLRDAGAALCQLGIFFGLDQPSAKWKEIASGPTFREHAKQPGVAFDANAYHAQHAAAAAVHAREIEATIEWAQALADRARAPIALGNTLLG